MATKRAANLKAGDVVALATLVRERGAVHIGETWARVIALEDREDGVGFDIAARPITGNGTLVIRQFALPDDKILYDKEATR